MSVELVLCLTFVTGLQQPGAHGPDHAMEPGQDPGSTPGAPVEPALVDWFGSWLHGGVPLGPGFGWHWHDPFAYPVVTFQLVGPPVGYAPFVPLGYAPWYGPGPAGLYGPAVPPVQPVGPRRPADQAVEVPEEVVDRLIAPRRPTLAQRAIAARLAGSGDRMFRRGHYGLAVRRYQQALNRAPDEDETLFKLGAALIAASQYAQAGQVLEEALGRRPDWPYVGHDLGGLFPDEQAIERVTGKLRGAARLDSASRHIPFLLGYVLYYTDRHDAAERVFHGLMRQPGGQRAAVFLEAIRRARQ